MASLKVLSSATVGPLAMELKSSLITSEMSKEIDLLGNAAEFNRPPFICETCFLTVLISFILQPDASNNCVNTTLSSKEIPSAGKDNNEDPPPLIRKIAKSV